MIRTLYLVRGIEARTVIVDDGRLTRPAPTPTATRPAQPAALTDGARLARLEALMSNPQFPDALRPATFEAIRGLKHGGLTGEELLRDALERET